MVHTEGTEEADYDQDNTVRVNDDVGAVNEEEGKKGENIAIDQYMK